MNFLAVIKSPSTYVSFGYLHIFVFAANYRGWIFFINVFINRLPFAFVKINISIRSDGLTLEGRQHGLALFLLHLPLFLVPSSTPSVFLHASPIFFRSSNVSS